MLNKIQNFFLDLQQKDQETKKRWLAIFTSVSMVAVISVWLVYLSSTVQSLGEPSSSKSADFFTILKNGLGLVSDKTGSELSQALAKLQELAKKTNSVTIQADPQK